MNKLLAFLIIGILTTFTSCRNSYRDNDTSTTSSESYWIASNQINTLLRQVHNVAIVDSVLNGVAPSEVTPLEACIDSISRIPLDGPFPIELTINYDTLNSCNFDRVRSGKIKVNFDGLYSTLGSKMTITTENYMVNNYAISAEITMELVYAVFDTLNYEVTVTNGTITDTKALGTSINHFESKINFANTTGRRTVTPADDNVIITGTGNGIATNGVIYNFTVEDENVLFSECGYETFGSTRLTASNQLDRILLFGEGSGCDKIMLVSIPPANGDQQVELP
jgi:hypothetical protein